MPREYRWRCLVLVAVSACLVPMAGCRWLPLGRVDSSRSGLIRPSDLPTLQPVSDQEVLAVTRSYIEAPAPEPTSTPMLDAALARARRDREVLLASLEEEAKPTPATAPTAPLPPVKTAPMPPPGPVVPPPPAPTPVEPDELPELGPAPTDEVPSPPATVTTRPAPLDESVRRAAVSVEAGPEGTAPIAGEPVPESVSPLTASATQPPVLAIAELALCRRVRGFGAYDAVDAAALRAGRPVIVYCQMVGLRYEALADDERYRSRIASRVELIREATGEMAWSQDFEPAEDICRKPRQDYYACYPIVLPVNLTPGTYRLSLSQTDLLADRPTRRETTLTVRP